MPGNIKSRMITLAGFWLSSANAKPCSPVLAIVAANPSASRLYLTLSAMSGSSSMIRTGFDILLPENGGLYYANCYSLCQRTIMLISLITRNDAAANAAAAGIVRTHAHTILPATRHLTADNRVVEPTPAIALVIVCVVDTGIPEKVAPKIVIAPAVSAQNPPTGLNFVIFEPIVWTMRQPPDSVPKAMAAWAARTTYKGICGSEPLSPKCKLNIPAVASTAVTMPI